MTSLGRIGAVLGILTFLLGVVAAARIVEQPGTTANTAPARTATEAWLALVDGGRYGESWEQAADLFKKAVPKEAWERQLSGVRGPIGELQSRKLESSQAVTALPGAPDGQYVVFTFAAAYAQKRTAVETVTAMREPDGGWRVAGYFIR